MPETDGNGRFIRSSPPASFLGVGVSFGDRLVVLMALVLGISIMPLDAFIITCCLPSGVGQLVLKRKRVARGLHIQRKVAHARYAGQRLGQAHVPHQANAIWLGAVRAEAA